MSKFHIAAEHDNTSALAPYEWVFNPGDKEGEDNTPLFLMAVILDRPAVQKVTIEYPDGSSVSYVITKIKE